MGQESTGKVESSIAMQFEVHATIMYVQKQYSALHAISLLVNIYCFLIASNSCKIRTVLGLIHSNSWRVNSQISFQRYIIDHIFVLDD